ncbi:MAG TPA: hypothetical protein VMP67_06060 [Candidatus Limnocylindria bacterium]|nr:hypothetical protein [Candidatus Limnocylindria bacterium]
MDAPLARHPHSAAGRPLRLAAAVFVALAALLPLAQPTLANDLTLEARALLGENVRPGSWAAVSVRLSNDGPSLSGELRIRSSQSGRSQYGLAVELPSGARQEHVVYAQPPVFGSRLHVDLISGGQAVATQEVRIRSHDTWSPIIAIVAERPEGIQPGVADVARNPQGQSANVVVLSPADLPPRVEAWSAIDRLVWQDVDAGLLTAEQQAALRGWLGAGGRLVIVGGTAGVAPLRGFPEDLLPYRPIETITVQPADLLSVFGQLPTDAAAVPAISGLLNEGASMLAQGAAGQVIGAQSSWGQGSVTLLGINPAESWLSDSAAGRGLWRRLLPLGAGPFINPLALPEDSMLVQALNNLPAVALPPIGQLFLLLFAYVALIGPVNYLVLRRLDKREWAWFTMPVLVAIFTVVSYGLGATLKGSDVIVNQLAIVRAGQGTGEGLGQVYVGVFSPSRRTFEVHVPGGALLSNAASQMQFGQTEQALDILFGDPSRLRNFEVGFGVLRGFRAEASTPAPRVGSDLRLVSGRLEGTVTNLSDVTLENVAVVFAGGAAILSEMGPGETRTLALDTSSGTFMGFALSERIFGSSFPRDPGEARVIQTRRMVIDQLTGHGPTPTGINANRPVLLAWERGPVLDVELPGERPNQVGDSLFMLPLAVSVDSQAVFGDALLAKTVVESSGEAWGDGSGFSLARGTIVVEVRPRALEGSFEVSALELAMTQGEMRNLTGNGTRIDPLPGHLQPNADDPLGEPPDPLEPPRFEDLPDLQLFDVVTGRWLEFPRPQTSRSYLINEPRRYVDDGGRLLARFVNRGGIQDHKWFTLVVRMEGSIR